jgi:muramoyltetrapeptide carboxypeptidase
LKTPQRPRRLGPGDTVGVIAPASAPPDPKKVDAAVAVLEGLGFKVRLGPNVRKRLGFLAGSDRERAADLMRMFTDRRVNAILCVRGGYGTARLLPRLDYAAIRANPKIFVGYSDITSLHCAFLTRAGLITFHGPMLNSDFADPALPEFTRRSFLRTLGAPPNADEHAAGLNLAAGYPGKTIQSLRRGVARGQLIGGNLSVLATTIGTPWQPPFRNRILFFEDVGEAPYRLDRLLTHLLNCGLLQQVAGIAIGINPECEDPTAQTAKEYRQTLRDVLRERLLPLQVPIVTGFPFGHVPHNATLPVGATVILDAHRGELVLPRPAVR